MMRIRVQRRYEMGEPFQEALAAVADAVSCVKADREELGEWLTGYARAHLHRLAFDFDEVRRCFPKGARILEIGCIPPILTLALARHGYRVEGLDVAPDRFAGTIARFGLVVHRCDLEREPLPFADASFDGVLFNEILEHLRGDLIAIFEEVLRVLKPGGRLILTTPNVRSVEGVLRFLFAGRSISCGGGIYDEYIKLRTIGHMGHVREYTVREITEFLVRLGFEVETIVHRGRYSGWREVVACLFPRMRPFMQFIARKPTS